jgi:hypothetical protein
MKFLLVSASKNFIKLERCQFYAIQALLLFGMVCQGTISLPLKCSFWAAICKVWIHNFGIKSLVLQYPPLMEKINSSNSIGARTKKNSWLHQCSITSVLPQGFRCATNFYKKQDICTLHLEEGSILSFIIRTHTHTHTHRIIITGFIQHVLFFVSICLRSYRARLFVKIHVYSHA